jgi:hypothetical protein
VKLFLWKLSQDVNNGYDTYSDAVVVSSTAETAKIIHPSTDSVTGERMFHYVEHEWRWVHGDSEEGDDCWADPKDIQATCVGVPLGDNFAEGAVICRSFHAG